MLSPGKQDSQKATDADLIAGEIYIYTNTILLSINHKQSKPGTACHFWNHGSWIPRAFNKYLWEEIDDESWRDV